MKQTDETKVRELLTGTHRYFPLKKLQLLMGLNDEMTLCQLSEKLKRPAEPIYSLLMRCQRQKLVKHNAAAVWSLTEQGEARQVYLYRKMMDEYGGIKNFSEYVRRRGRGE